MKTSEKKSIVTKILLSVEPEDILFKEGGKCYPVNMDMTDEVTYIDDSFYAGCEFLESVNFPDSVTEIGNSSFADCPALETINIPANLKTIGFGAFQNCVNLAGVLDFPDSVDSMGENAFMNCENLQSVTLPPLKTISKNLFYNCKNLSGTVVIPNTVEAVGQSAFQNCEKLDGVIISTGLNALSLYMFSGSGIRELNIPSNITVLNVDATSRMPRLTKAVLNHGVERIASNNFRYCSLLKELSLPNTITLIQGNVFDSCPALEFVTLESGFDCDNLNLSASSLYSADTLAGILDALADRTGKDAYTLTLGSKNLAKLSEEQKAAATAKNWILK